MQSDPNTKNDLYQNALWAGIPAILMIAYGWLAGAFIDPYLEWTIKIGGICLAFVTIIYLIGLRIGLILDMVVSGACGVSLIGCELRWSVQYGLSFDQLIIMVFGVLFLGAARSAWKSYRGPPAQSAASRAESRRPPPPEPPHPASIHPKSLPKDGEPAPEEGYLAALSKEKEEPPKASYE